MRLLIGLLLLPVYALELPYNKVKEIRTNVPFGVPLFLRKPMVIALTTVCKAYPAVDEHGNHSGGLPGWEGTNKNCRHDSQGQMYGRVGQFGPKVAYAYCVYLPQALPLNGPGHRHDWECITLWTYKGRLDAVVSSHYGEIPKKKWKYLYGRHLRLHLTQPDSFGKVQWNGTGLMPTSLAWGQDEDHLPLIDVDQMPRAARQALEDNDFDGHYFPLRDKRSAFSDFLGRTFERPDTRPGGGDEESEDYEALLRNDMLGP